MWGACSPKDCDWGTKHVDGPADGRIRLTWVTSFAEKTQTLSLQGGRLRVETHTQFTDDSGRADRDSLDVFSK